MSLTLLAAPSGVGLSEAVERLARVAGVDVYYVEKELLADPNTWTQGSHPLASARRNMRDLLYRYTRHHVRQAWVAAFQRCLEQAEASTAADQVIAFHPSIYAKQRSEEYSTIEWLPDFTTLKPQRVILLIDDVFDMWARLGEAKGDLFFHHEWLNLRLEMQDLADTVGRNTGLLSPTEGKEDLFNRLVLDSAQAILSRLLGWRHLDMIEAESLAFQLAVQLTVLGTKHPWASFLKLIQDDSVQTAYLSHPISRPRTTRRQGVEWPPVVAQSNALSPMLVGKSICLICPTAIDELRFHQPQDPFDVHQRNFALDERWPLIVPAEDSIAVRDQISNDLMHINVDLSLTPSEVVGSMAKSLESQIFSDVPFRDHFLVTHTQSFLVFRPLYGTGGFSQGVKAEIAHWADLRQIQSGRRAIFLHAQADVIVALDSFISSFTHARLDEFTKRYLLAQGLDDEQIASALTGESAPAAMLEADAPDADAVQDVVARAREWAVLASVFSRLTSLNVDYFRDAQVAISIMQGDAPTDAEATGYSAFLRTGELDDQHFLFRAQLTQVIGADPIEWVNQRLSV